MLAASPRVDHQLVKRLVRPAATGLAIYNCLYSHVTWRTQGNTERSLELSKRLANKRFPVRFYRQFDVALVCGVA